MSTTFSATAYESSSAGPTLVAGARDHARVVSLPRQGAPSVRGAFTTLTIALAMQAAFTSGTVTARAALATTTIMAAVLIWKYFGSQIRGVVATLVSVAVCAVSADPWMAPLPFLVLLGAAAWRAQPLPPLWLRVMAVSLCIDSCVMMIEASGLVWQELGRVSWAISAFMTAESDIPVRFGFIEGNLHSVVFLLAVGVAQSLFARSRLSECLRIWLLIVLGLLPALAFQQPLLPVLIAAGAVALLGQGSVPAHPVTYSSWRVALGFCLLILAAGQLLLSTQGRVEVNQSRSKTVAVLAAGMQSFDYPGRDDLLSRVTDANFAAWPRVLRTFAWQFRTIEPELNADRLAGVDVLMVINLDVHLTQDAQEAVRSFVNQGGRLLVLGDHTDIGGIMRPLNELLSFTDIRFEFDSAIPVDLPGWKWRQCLRGSWHPATYHRTNADFGISVGASLNVGRRARVLVQGDRCFGDIGDPDFGISRLGNMRYDPGEKRGSLALVAQQRVGQGVVEAWGDTTGFQSTVLTGGFASKISMLEDLATRTPPSWPRPLAVCIWTASVALAVWLQRHLISGLALGATATGLMVALVLHVRARTDTMPIMSAQSVVTFDMSHGPAAPSLAQDTWIDGLAGLVLRCERVLLAERNFQSMIEAMPSAIIISEPTRAYSDAESNSLLEYVESGGRLIIACGPRGRQCLSGALVALRFDMATDTMGACHRARLEIPLEIENVPAPPASRAVHPSDVDAEPAESFAPYDAQVGFADGHAVSCHMDEARALVSCWGHALVVQRPFGLGSVTLIGDPRFFTDKVLQYGNPGSQSLDPRNARLLAEFIIP